jgi:translocation and assembly module TamB
MDASTPARPTPPEPAPPAPRQRRHVGWWLSIGALAVALVAALGALLIGLAWTTEPPLAWLLARVPGLTVDGLRGTLRQGDFTIRRVDWRLPGGARLRIDDLRLEGLAWRDLYAMQLRSARAERVQFESGPPLGKAPSPPAQLTLPIRFQVLSLQAATVQIDQLPPMRRVAGALALGDDAGARHRIELQSMDWESARLLGKLEIGTTGALDVKAQLQARAIGGELWSAQASAAGPLQKLAITASAEGRASAQAGPLALQAEATVAPFAAWPLAALKLSTRQLDLAALSPRLPATLIDGQAEVDSSGLDRPASAHIALSNTRPGRIDEGRLPLRALDMALEGEPRHPERLALKRFDLRLGNERHEAGRAGGSGRWADGRLELAITLDGLLPEQLDRRAAPLQASGPLTLEVSGLPAPGAAAASKAPFGLKLQGRLAGRSLDGSGLPVRLQLNLDGDATRWTLRQASAEAGAARASAQGEATREDAGWRLAAKAQLQRFDPLPWWRGTDGSAWRRGPHEWNATADTRLLWRDRPPVRAMPTPWPAALAGELDLRVTDSRLAGVPLAGRFTARLADAGAHAELDAQLGGNQVAGQLDTAPDGKPQRWQLKADAPALAALAPALAIAAEAAPATAGWLPSAGAVQAEASGDGPWPTLRTRGQLRARGLRSREAALAEADLRWERGDGADPKLLLRLNARGLQHSAASLERVEAELDGTLSQHQLRFSADTPLRPPAWTESLLGPAGTGSRVSLEGRGAWTSAADGHRWAFSAARLQGGARDATGTRPWLGASEVAGRLQFSPTGEMRALQLDPGRLQLLNTGLRWRDATWQAGATADAAGRFALSAELDSFDVAALLQRQQPDFGWSGNLTIGGRVDLRHAGRFDADIVLERGGGDLGVTDELGQTQVLGLTDLRLAFSAHDGLWQFAQGLAGRQIGEMAGAQVVQTTADRSWPHADATLQGVLQMRVANLAIWSPWVPPGWRLGGSLSTSASIGGRFNAPELRGEMQGSGLAVRNLLEGINVSDGELAITLEGERAQIQRFAFKGGDGRLSLAGGATLGTQPAAKLTLTAEQFRLLGRIDRRIIASGQADLALERSSVKLDGRFRIDEGLIDVSRAEAPGLDSDVHIVVPARSAASANGAASAPAALAGAARPAAAASAPRGSQERPPGRSPLQNTQVDVAIDLGDRLRLRGRGIDTGLRGQLRVSSPGNRMGMTGSVRTDGGTYAAYGQKMEISRGEFSFTGALNNPRLDVLAVRPNLDVVVGVSVTGTAQNPRIRLVSEPEMPEMDKLSWLILGRSPDGLGRTDTALLQRAAIALLAGEGSSPTDDLIKRLGLTDFSVRQSDGEVRETIVSLGRQLSQRWYVGYERGVNTTAGTWQLIYRAAQRFTLRAQSGSENAVDAIWSWRW